MHDLGPPTDQASGHTPGQPPVWLVALLAGVALALIVAAIALTVDTLNRPPQPAPTVQEA
ncbi:hypothetical protein [Nonomuraea sp. SBT364]|uniref:hypothetical protein n=1 Tax=Nonomuraea sp. SBT364 TaxID=1580530 RepID=UPI00066C7A5E|nr:hypothetical protein [Nonomuraea sp. SBT364]